MGTHNPRQNAHSVMIALVVTFTGYSFHTSHELLLIAWVGVIFKDADTLLSITYLIIDCCASIIIKDSVGLGQRFDWILGLFIYFIYSLRATSLARRFH